MSLVTMTFNGTKLEDIIEIHDINRSVGNNRSIIASDAPKIGTNVQFVNTSEKKITVDFSVWSKDRNERKHFLAGLFNVNEPKQLIFSDEPDKYYLAIPIGSIDMVEVSNYRSQGTMEFYIPDGTAHSSTYKRVVDYRQEGSTLIFNLKNNGNVDALPIFNLKGNGENGYVGIVNQRGALEIGNIEELDGKIVDKSVDVFDFRKSKITQALTVGTQNQAISNVVEPLDGRITTVNMWERPHLVFAKGSTDSGLTAGSVTFNIQEETLYDYVWWRQIMWMGRPGMSGYMKVIVTDSEDKLLYGVETFARTNSTKCEYNVMVADGAGGYNIRKRFSFDATDKDTQNPFNKDRGWSDISRQNNKVSFYWWGKRHDFEVPEIENIPSKKVSIIMGCEGTKDLVTHMYIDEFRFRKDKVAFTEDVPNVFAAGTVIDINSETDTIAVDGIYNNDVFVDGSDFITIPPGDSELRMTFSSWTTAPPTATISYEERWL